LNSAGLSSLACFMFAPGNVWFSFASNKVAHMFGLPERRQELVC
jgi:hypothetical protein